MGVSFYSINMDCIADMQAELRSSIARYINDQGHTIKAETVWFDKPQSSEQGDISTAIALKCAKEIKQDPYTLAKGISKFLTDKQLRFVSQIKVAKPGFINIKLDDEFLEILIKTIITESEAYGQNDSLVGTKWVVEHTSPNPNKAMHLGHLRNNLIGMSLVKLLTKSGAKVFSDAIDNNRGIAIAKLMWGFITHMKKPGDFPPTIENWVKNKEQWYTPEEKDMSPDIFVTNCYTLCEADFKKDKETEKKVRDLVVKWEAGDEQVRELWRFLLAYAYDGMKRTLTRLGSHWDKVWHEHEHYKEGGEYVRQGLKRGIFHQLDDGAILSNLAKYKLPDTVLLKNDGTSLYITQDIALTAKKKEHYQADNLVWVVGPDQSLAMQQLFAVCEQLGIGKISEFTHIPYGYVGLKDGDGFKRMSSREGTTILIDDVIDGVKEKLAKRSEAKTDTTELTEKLALAAVKFSLLKSDRKQDLTFDTEQSIETTGASGIYVLYTYVRIKSILRKKPTLAVKLKNDQTEPERLVSRQLMYFPAAIERAGMDLSVHHIAQYLLELCSTFNTWYGQDVILDGSDRESHKLAIATAVSQVIENGLSILGIDTVEEI